MKKSVRKIELGWRLWSLIVGFFIVVGIAGFSYAYGSANPSVMGHTADEISGLNTLSQGGGSSSFGEITNKSFNKNTQQVEEIKEGEIYTAQEEGFLIGVLVRGDGDTASYSVVYVDKNVSEVENNNQKSLRGSASTYAYHNYIKSSSFNIPIKKGEYFKIKYIKEGANAIRAYSWMSLN